jgi:hypothetical protein
VHQSSCDIQLTVVTTYPADDMGRSLERLTLPRRARKALCCARRVGKEGTMKRTLIGLVVVAVNPASSR